MILDQTFVSGVALLLLPVSGQLQAVAASSIPARRENKTMTNFTLPSPEHSLLKGRADDSNDNGDFTLQQNETWTWNMNGTSTPLAQMDCSFKASNGSRPLDGMAMALEPLMSAVTNLTCSMDGTEMTVQWKDKDSYDTAKSSWNWVNEKSERYIAMVVDSTSCGGYRRPYKVSSYNTTDSNLSMNMKAQPIAWQDAFPFMNLTLSTSGLTQSDQNEARDLVALDKRVGGTAHIDLAHDFSNVNIFSQNVSDALDVALTCGSCMTTGSIDITFDGSFSIFSGVSATITVTTTGVSATVGLDLVVSGELTSEVDQTVTFVNFPLAGLNIAGLIDVGPSIMVNMDAKIESVTAQVDISLGSVTTSITDGAKAVVDLFDSSKDSNMGFTPQFSTQGPSVSAGISASANFGPNIVLGLDVSALGKGLAAGLALAVPQLDLTASLNENGCTGVEFDAGLTAQLNAFGGVGKVADVAATNTISLIGTSTQIFSTCLTVPSAAAADVATTTADATATATTA